MGFPIDENVLVKCLKSAENLPTDSKITIKSYEKNKADFVIGSNCTSDAFRICIDYDCDGLPGKKRMFLKVPSLSYHYDYMKKLGFYDNEVCIYEKILPNISRLLGFHVAPIHYCTLDTENLVLEDLCDRGYEVEAREKLNLEQAATVLRTLAQFHAASAKLCRESKSLFATLSDAVLFSKMMAEDVITVFNGEMAAVLRNEGIPDRTISNYRKYETEISCLYDIPGGYKLRVLNHGDLKCNNILLRYDEKGLPLEAKIIDYQTPHLGSPIFDLIFFFLTSIPYPVFKMHFEELLDGYLGTMNKTLKAIDFDGNYERLDFEEDLARIKPFRMFCLYWTGYLVIRTEAKETRDFGRKDLPATPAQIEAIRLSPKFREGFLIWFRYFEKIGMF